MSGNIIFSFLIELGDSIETCPRRTALTCYESRDKAVKATSCRVCMEALELPPCGIYLCTCDLRSFGQVTKSFRGS
jgi:hypothetical protein